MEKEWLYEYIIKFGKDIEWFESILEYLFSSKIIISTVDIRTLHLESAKRMVSNFLIESSKEERKLFYSIIQNELLSQDCSLRGISWFLRSMFAHKCSDALYYFVLTPDFVSQIIRRCFQANNSEKRASAAHIIDFIVGRKYGASTFRKVIKEYPILYNWINNVDNETAYAYSNILNNLHNEDPALHKEFVSKLDINKITQQLSKITEDYLYSWGSFIDRLSILQSKEWLSDFFKRIPHEHISNIIKKLLLIILVDWLNFCVDYTIIGINMHIPN